MKEYIRNLMLYILIFFFAISLFAGIVIPDIPLYYIATYLVLCTSVMLVKPLLSFLTIKINFITYLLMLFLILVGVFFLLKIFMTGFFINSMDFAGIDWDFLKINGFKMSSIVIILLISLLSSLLTTIFYSLEKKS